MFVDRVRVVLRAGDGGAGVASFRKSKGRPRGRPDGGSGGKGGDVFLVADDSVASLLTYQHRPHRRAESGTHGEGDLRHGRRGEDLELKVPLGTVVHDPDGTVVADLVAPAHRYLAARGGRGGRGNAALVSPERRAPEFSEQGEYGEERELILEVQLLADAALVGFPNAGKSTLISSVSAARPRVADYPFTTLEPHLGVVTTEERQLVLADIPGLIEGAAEGKGLGHEFLRHTTRARLLVILLDPSPLQETPPIRQLDVLESELADYSAELAARPRLVVISKADLPEAAAALEAVRATVPGVMAVSAVTGHGLAELVGAMADAVAVAERAAPERPGFVLHRPAVADIEIRREDDTWVVAGRSVARAVGVDDLTKAEAADLVAKRLERLGVDEQLRNAGARPGDEVRIGDLVFEFDPHLVQGDG